MYSKAGMLFLYTWGLPAEVDCGQSVAKRLRAHALSKNKFAFEDNFGRTLDNESVAINEF